MLLSWNLPETCAQELLNSSEGKVPVENQLGEHKIKLDQDFILETDKLSDLCSFVFDGMDDNYNRPYWLTCNTISKK